MFLTQVQLVAKYHENIEYQINDDPFSPSIYPKDYRFDKLEDVDKGFEKKCHTIFL
jgi:hypothetical protein